MILNELHGYKQYLDKDFYELMNMLKQHAYINDEGAFSTVVIPKQGDSVYKVWTNDSGYETYYRIAMSMQGNEFVPKMGRIHRLPIFFKRPDTVDGFLKIVKIERLKPLPRSTPDYHTFSGALCTFLKIFVNSKVNLSGFKQEHAKRDVEIFASQQAGWIDRSTIKGAQGLDVSAKVLDRMTQSSDDLFKLAIALRQALINNEGDLDLDMHMGNVMLRGDHPVIIDPFCLGDGMERYQRDRGMLFMNHLDTNIEAINDAVQRGKFASASVKSGTRPSLKD